METEVELVLQRCIEFVDDSAAEFSINEGRELAECLVAHYQLVLLGLRQSDIPH